MEITKELLKRILRDSPVVVSTAERDHLSAYLACRLGELRTIACDLASHEKERDKAIETYNASMAKINEKLAGIMSICPDYVTRDSTGSGNNDSFKSCVLCGTEFS